MFPIPGDTEPTYLPTSMAKCYSCLVSIAVFPLVKRRYAVSDWMSLIFSCHSLTGWHGKQGCPLLHTTHVSSYKPPMGLLPSSRTFSLLTQFFSLLSATSLGFQLTPSPAPPRWLFLYIDCPCFLLTNRPPCLNGPQTIWDC